MIARWTFAALVIIAFFGFYWLARRVQLLLTHAEQLLNVGAQLLAAVPSKSAPRTDGDDAQPHRWWQKLRALTAAEVPVTEPIPAQPAPDPGPPTVPAAEAITPQAIADDDWLAEQTALIDQQVADAKAQLFAAYPAPTLRRET